MSSEQKGQSGGGITTDGVITIILTLASWTSIPLFLRYFAQHIDGWTANGWRYGFSALIWLPALLIGLRKKTLPAGLWRVAFVPAIFNTAAQVCFGLAPYYIDPGLMTFSLRLQIVFVTVGALLMFPAERRVIRSAGYLVGIGLVVAGTGATLLLNPTGLGEGTATGVMLAIGAGLLYGCYSLSVRKCLHGINPITAFAAISLYTAVGMVGLMFVFGKDGGAGALELSRARFLFMLLSSLVGIGLGHTLYFYSISRLGLALSAGVVQLQPITVSIASYFIFAELLTGWQWTFGVVAVFGAGFMLWTQHRIMSRASERTAPIDEFDDLPIDPSVALVGQANESTERSVSKLSTDKQLPATNASSGRR